VSETELSVVCKNCGAEVSPYVTECPYCGARIRKRAPKLERRGDALEAKRSRRERRRGERRARAGRAAEQLAGSRPYATLAIVLGSALLLLVQEASGYRVYGGLGIPFEDDAWRYLSAPFTYGDPGYWFVASLGLVIFGTGLERRLGSVPVFLLLVACGVLGMLGAYRLEDALDGIGTIAGGNGMALGALAAWYAIRRAEVRDSPEEEEVDVIGVAVCAGALLALPIFDASASVFAGLIGAGVGWLAGLAAARAR
jgi:membrane associated rhomboid family serine protease